MKKKKTTEEFITQAKEVHGDKYDYSKVNYINAISKVIIICSEHDEFEQTPNSHLQGVGCAKCGILKRSQSQSLNTEEFIKRAKEIHGNKYDYSKVNYVNNHSKVSIVCVEHGEFEQIPSSHLQGSGCVRCAILKCSQSQSLNTEEFTKKAKEVHGNKYNYSKVNYVNNHSKISIICPKHGEFEQIPSNHLQSKGCDKCGGSFQLNIEEFKKRAKEIHNNKYDYSKVNYVNSKSKVIIICSEHGEFEQIPSSHLQGSGCVKCSGKLVSNTEEFLKRAKEVHGNKYDYSKVNYVNTIYEIVIICPEQGEFEQIPNSHLQGRGCVKCAGRFVSNTEEFLKRAKEIHSNKYDYSKVNYVNSTSKVIIICPKHGEFKQIPSSHLQGSGCVKCGGCFPLNTEEFKKRAKEIHNNKYDYSKVNYVNSKSKVIIICPKHDEFKQTPYSHLQGKGCQRCSESKGERLVSLLLEKMGLNYKREVRYKECKYKKSLPFDFLVTVNRKIKFLIEYQGMQHYEPVRRNGMSVEKANEKFNEVIKRDKIKKDYAKKHKIPFIEIPYWYNKTKIEKVLLKKIEKLKGKVK